MNNPVGIFDSGIGGLTVMKQIMQLLPNENLVYFGDTARVPYGTKSKKLIQQYALEDAAFLSQFDIKLLVVACNSASAAAVDLLKSQLDIPVTGVIEPGVTAALHTSSNKRIGVIGTTATVGSGAYQELLFAMDNHAQVFGQPCPLLVPLVEEGWIDDQITRLTIHKYLDPLLADNIDTLILGCTHFPVLKKIIQSEIGTGITLIDSGQETAKIVRNMLDDMAIGRNKHLRGKVEFYVSDIPGKFDEIGTRFLGRPVVNANRVDFDQFLMKQGDKIYKALNFTAGSL